MKGIIWDKGMNMIRFNKEKYLKKLKFKKHERYIYLGLSFILILVIGIYFAYSKYSVSKDTEVVRTTVGNFISGDIVITPYIDGEYSKEFPKDEVGINVEKVLCDNDVTASWDEDKLGLKITDLTKRTKCNVYFVTPKSCGINDNVTCINSREELSALATEVNNGDNKLGKIIYLTSDIDLGGKFDSDGNALDGNISWTPIGTDNNRFSGIFDGNGHVIKNMYIKDTANVSLINYATSSVIKNVGIVDSYLNSTEGHASALIGEITNGIVKNSFSNSIVIGQKFTGGLVSRLYYGTLKNCYNAGSVNGDVQFAAGIVSYETGDDSVIKNVYNYGKVTGFNEDGGIVGGVQGLVKSAYNLGDVENYFSTCGGIAGQAYLLHSPRINDSYNVGQIKGRSIVYDLHDGDGVNEGHYGFSNNFYLKDSATLAEETEAVELSKDEMPSVISVINGDNAFVSDINNINNGYPILKWQANR